MVPLAIFNKVFSCFLRNARLQFNLTTKLTNFSISYSQEFLAYPLLSLMVMEILGLPFKGITRKNNLKRMNVPKKFS